jgi:hypothetical protein
MGVEPLPGEAAALADCGTETALVVADYHAGIEAGLRRQGVELESGAERRRTRLRALLDRESPDRLVLLGDVGHAIGEPGRSERRELEALLSETADRVPVTVTMGNHDGGVESVAENHGRVRVTDGPGVRLGPVGFAHGHTWPSREVLGAETLCVAHEHPVVRLEDDVGGRRVERAWLRGPVGPSPFRARHGADSPTPERLVVFPAFNRRSGGTWINVTGQAFLSPFLPEAVPEAEAYLLDGTRLGTYSEV